MARGFFLGGEGDWGESRMYEKVGDVLYLH